LKAEEKKAFFEKLLPQLQALPGVVSATELIALPLVYLDRTDITIPGKAHSDPWFVGVEMCSEGYFQTVGVHLLRGRLLTSADVLSARKVAVINERMARQYFAGEDPIGRQVKFNVFDELPESPRDAYFEVVGVVSAGRNNMMSETSSGTRVDEESTISGVFLPYSVSGFGNRSIAMLTRVPPASLINNVRQLLWAMDHDAVLVAPNLNAITGFSLDILIDGLVYGKPRFAAIAFAACAGLGFALAIVGLFSVMNYIVSLKTHDIGVRLAMGATPAGILGMILKRGLLLILPGIAMGLLASFAVTRFLSSLVHGISTTDPITLMLVVVCVAIPGLAACLVPARRATKVDPMVALRYE
jgi:putative ABC transport system permease protein